MNEKTGLDFQNAAKIKRINSWHIRDCSMCKYPIKYLFAHDYEKVWIDTGCYCTRTQTIRGSSWASIAENYNMQENEQYINELNEFWGFDKEIKSGWISVKDKLPPEFHEVMYVAINEHGSKEIMNGHRQGNYWTHCCMFYSTLGLCDDIKVTHWMELPDYPEIDKGLSSETATQLSSTSD